MAPSLLLFASAKVVKIFQLKDDDGQKFLFLTSFLSFVSLCFFCNDVCGYGWTNVGVAGGVDGLFLKWKLKGRLSGCQRPSFVLQKMAFYTPKDGLWQSDLTMPKNTLHQKSLLTGKLYT